MTQAYPQFTPVQILEAGQRAMAEGRAEYAAQFFQHLIEHYADTAEAASARDAMVRLGFRKEAPPAPPVNDTAPPPQRESISLTSVLGSLGKRSGEQPQSSASQQPLAARATQQSTSNGSPQGTQSSGQGTQLNGQGTQLNVQGAQLNVQGTAPLSNAGPNGVAPGAAPNGLAQNATSNGPALGAPAATQAPPSLGRPKPAADAPDVPRQPSARRGEAARRQAPPVPSTKVRLFVPAPEKHYIIGRVISGLLLLLGVLGIFAGIMLIYAALSDPRVLGTVGIETFAQGLLFAGSVFVGSLIMLIVSQMATALFDAADASTDLARLERYRAGDYDVEGDD